MTGHAGHFQLTGQAGQSRLTGKQDSLSCSAQRTPVRPKVGRFGFVSTTFRALTASTPTRPSDSANASRSSGRESTLGCDASTAPAS